jgi:hypothetical protein
VWDGGHTQEDEIYPLANQKDNTHESRKDPYFFRIFCEEYGVFFNSAVPESKQSIIQCKTSAIMLDSRITKNSKP